MDTCEYCGMKGKYPDTLKITEYGKLVCVDAASCDQYYFDHNPDND